MVAGEASTPAEALLELARDASADVIGWLASNEACTTEVLEVAARHHPERAEITAWHPSAPLEALGATPIGTLASRVLQSYMDRIGATSEQWDEVQRALEAAPVPGGPLLRDVVARAGSSPPAPA